jgi:hypothetical protein
MKTYVIGKDIYHMSKEMYEKMQELIRLHVLDDTPNPRLDGCDCGSEHAHYLSWVVDHSVFIERADGVFDHEDIFCGYLNSLDRDRSW